MPALGVEKKNLKKKKKKQGQMPTSTLNSLFVYKIDSNETIKKKVCGYRKYHYVSSRPEIKKKTLKKVRFEL